MTVLIIKNCSREGAGLIEAILKMYSISFVVFDLEKGQQFPDPRKYQAVIVLGGPDSANDNTPKILQELFQIEVILKEQIPFLGICLGLQLLVKAGGGNVIKNAVREIGWRDHEGHFYELHFTEQGKKHPLFAGLKSPLKIFQLHGETVTLTEQMILLATGTTCQNQVVQVGPVAFGIQGHVELTAPMFDLWMSQDEDLRQLDPEKMQKDYHDHLKEYEQIGLVLLTNFLRVSHLIN